VREGEAMPRVEQQAPQVLAFVLVDTLHRDRATHNCSLLGTFTAIATPAFPCIWDQICAYIALVGGRGETPLKLLLVDSAGDQVYEQEAIVTFSDPLVVAEVTFTAKRVSLTKTGTYHFRLFGAGQLLCEYRLHVAQLVTELGFDPNR
jgi:Family of unknown function (DUF6941)